MNPDTRKFDSVIVYGSGRGGTTWVQDVLAEANGFDTVFEPLHPEAVPKAAPFANLYLRPDEACPELEAFLETVFAGRLRSVWASLRQRPDRLLPPVRSLFTRNGLAGTKIAYERALQRWWRYREGRSGPKVVKFIRANLLLDWINERFQLPAVAVVRHPCAVFSSAHQRFGDEWSGGAMAAQLSRYLDQPALINDRLSGIADTLRTLDSTAAIHAATWCIENANFVAGNGQGNVQLAWYEHLVTSPDDSWAELVAGLGLANVPTPELLARPSQQARYTLTSRTDSFHQISTWQDKLTAEQVADIQGVLDLFGIERYHTSSVLPVEPTSTPVQVLDEADHG